MAAVRSIKLVLALALLFAVGCSESAPNSPGAAAADKISDFDANRAYEHARKLVELGPRPSGSEAIRKAQEYIKGELKSYGLRVIEQDFTAETPLGKIPMKNIIGELAGQRPDIVIISGHYDTKREPSGFLGANDGASSAAAVLEMARVLSRTKHEYTLWFVFFDGEEAVLEWGAMGGRDNTYGSRHMVSRLRSEGALDRVAAMILVDMIGDRQLDIRRDEESTPWLVEIIWNTARQIGHGRYFLENPIWIADDHIPFKEAGIPAVDIIDFNYGPGNSYWHTLQDTLDKISGESIKVVGDVVIRALPEIFNQLNSRRPKR